jgi:ABC-2 type transport system ATP-binding protein
MDEPTIGLDHHQIQGIRKLIDNLRGKHTVILSSHILPEIERSCDRVIIINRGRIVASGTSTDLREEFLPGNRFSLIVEGSDDAISACLAQNGLEATILESTPHAENRSKLILRVENDGELGPQLIQALSNQAEFTLHSLAPREPNLEEIFLAATKRSWEETIETKPKINV